MNGKPDGISEAERIVRLKNNQTVPPRLVDFIYLLLRDEVLPGDMEGYLKEISKAPVGVASIFSNKYLAAYAEDIAGRLLGEEKREPTK